MNEQRKALEKHFLFGALFCAVIFIISYILLVGTPAGHQFDDNAFNARRSLSHKIAVLDSRILDLVRKSTLLAAAIVTLLIAGMRRCIFAGAVAVAAFGFAVVGAEILKIVLPWSALVTSDTQLESGFQMNTFPSGHATIGTSLTLCLLLVLPSRWRPRLSVFGGAISATFATGVLFVGWHRPSDAIGALAWSGFCMSLAAAFLVRLRGRPQPASERPLGAVLGSAVLGTVLAIATWLISVLTAPDYILVDFPFFVVTGIIFAGAFTLIIWYGCRLRAVDWYSARSNRRSGMRDGE